MGQLRVMNATGDVTLEWDAETGVGVKEASREFDRLVAEGHLTYRKGEERATRGEAIREFDPTAPLIVSHPRPVGG